MNVALSSSSLFILPKSISLSVKSKSFVTSSPMLFNICISTITSFTSLSLSVFSMSTVISISSRSSHSSSSPFPKLFISKSEIFSVPTVPAEQVRAVVVGGEDVSILMETG